MHTHTSLSWFCWDTRGTGVTQRSLITFPTCQVKKINLQNTYPQKERGKDDTRQKQKCPVLGNPVLPVLPFSPLVPGRPTGPGGPLGPGSPFSPGNPAKQKNGKKGKVWHQKGNHAGYDLFIYLFLPRGPLSPAGPGSPLSPMGPAGPLSGGQHSQKLK